MKSGAKIPLANKVKSTLIDQNIYLPANSRIDRLKYVSQEYFHMYHQISCYKIFKKRIIFFLIKKIVKIDLFPRLLFQWPLMLIKAKYA